MNKIILTLCLVMIALIGASAVAASADADNASNVELVDECHLDNVVIDYEPSSQIDSLSIRSLYKDEVKYHALKHDAAYRESLYQIRVSDYADFEKELAKLREEMEKSKQTEEKEKGNKSCIDVSEKSKQTEEKEQGNKSCIDVPENVTITDHKFDKSMYLEDNGNLVDDVDCVDQESFHCQKSALSSTKSPQEYITKKPTQDTVDKDTEKIEDPLVDSIYRKYGSYTLDAISDYFRMSPDEVKDIIHKIKSGEYGETFKNALLKRDKVSALLDMEYYIID